MMKVATKITQAIIPDQSSKTWSVSQMSQNLRLSRNLQLTLCISSPQWQQNLGLYSMLRKRGSKSARQMESMGMELWGRKV